MSGDYILFGANIDKVYGVPEAPGFPQGYSRMEHFKLKDKVVLFLSAGIFMLKNALMVTLKELPQSIDLSEPCDPSWYAAKSKILMKGGSGMNLYHF